MACSTSTCCYIQLSRLTPLDSLIQSFKRCRVWKISRCLHQACAHAVAALPLPLQSLSLLRCLQPTLVPHVLPNDGTQPSPPTPSRPPHRHPNALSPPPLSPQSTVKLSLTSLHSPPTSATSYQSSTAARPKAPSSQRSLNSYHPTHQPLRPPPTTRTPSACPPSTAYAATSTSTTPSAYSSTYHPPPHPPQCTPTSSIDALVAACTSRGTRQPACSPHTRYYPTLAAATNQSETTALLFCRRVSGGSSGGRVEGYRYYGRVGYVSHDEAVKPIQFVLELLDAKSVEEVMRQEQLQTEVKAETDTT